MGAFLTSLFKSYSTVSTQKVAKEIKKTCWRRNIAIQAVSEVSEEGTQVSVTLSEQGTQVSVTLSEEETQTPVSILERLTDYGARVVGSTETYDHLCDICDEDTAAVGYCRHCEQYYCLKCCKCHEKGKLTCNHTIVSKQNFEQIGHEHTLFKRKIVPVSLLSLPKTYLINYRGDSISYKFQIKALLTLKDTNKTVIFHAPDHRDFYLLSQAFMYIISDDSETKSFQMKQSCETFIQHSLRPDEIVVTVPGTREVKYMSLSTPGQLNTLFKTSGACWGLAEFDNGYAVSIVMATGLSYIPPWQIQYLDCTGKVKKRIMYDNKGKALFQEPKYLASSAEKDVLFVGDKKNIKVFNVLGEILQVLRWSPDEDSYRGIQFLSVDSEHNVYMIYNKNLLQLNKDGSKHRVLASSSDISCSCFDTLTETLTVSNSYGGISIFKLLP